MITKRTHTCCGCGCAFWMACCCHASSRVERGRWGHVFTLDCSSKYPCCTCSRYAICFWVDICLNSPLEDRICNFLLCASKVQMNIWSKRPLQTSVIRTTAHGYSCSHALKPRSCVSNNMQLWMHCTLSLPQQSHSLLPTPVK